MTIMLIKNIYGSDQGGFQGRLSRGFVYKGLKLGTGWIAALEPRPANGWTRFQFLPQNGVSLNFPSSPLPPKVKMSLIYDPEQVGR